MNALKFFRQFVSEPVAIGAISASSKKVAEVVTEFAGVSKSSCVVEWGAGTGAITGTIHDAMPQGSDFIAMEINPEFCKILRKRLPHVRVVEDSATNTKKYLADLGRTGCDVIISGLPFAAFNEEIQNQLLDTIQDVLKPGGTFVTFGYVQARILPGGRKIKRKLLDRFEVLEKTPTIWQNLPPAFAYRARKIA